MSEVEGVLLMCVVVDESGAMVEKRSEVDGAPMAFMPMRDAPDGFDPITFEVLVSVWLVECGGVTVKLVCGYL